MNDAIILQQIYAGSEYAEAVKLTLPRHLDYARLHNFDYDFYYGDIIKEWPLSAGGWAKLPIIIRALERGYKYIVWMDADSLIADMSADLRKGCPPDGIGFVVHSADVKHFNVGNIYITSSPRVREFLLDWVSWYPGPASWHEQAVLNLLALAPVYSGIVQEIDPKYNSCRSGGSHVPGAVVEGFHGEGDVANRIKLMRKFLKGKK